MVVAVIVLSVLVFRHRPEGMGQHPDGVDGAAARLQEAPIHVTRRSLRRERRFVTLAAGMTLGLFAQIGLLAHLFSLLVPVLGAGVTGVAMGGATLAAILGRFVVGWMMPPAADRRVVACVSYGVQVIGSLLFIISAGDGGLWAGLGIALFGLGIGNATSLPPLIAQQEFPPAKAGRVVPLIVAIGQAGYAFAPAVFGLLRAGGSDASGAVALFLFAAAIQLAAIGSLLAARGRGQGRRRAGLRRTCMVNGLRARWCLRCWTSVSEWAGGGPIRTGAGPRARGWSADRRAAAPLPARPHRGAA